MLPDLFDEASHLSSSVNGKDDFGISQLLPLVHSKLSEEGQDVLPLFIGLSTSQKQSNILLDYLGSGPQ